MVHITDMARKLSRQDITPEMLRELVEYDCETGALYWRRRSVQWFIDGAHSAEHTRKTWNARFAGQRAFDLAGAYGCRQGLLFRVMLKAHRVAYAMHYGRWPTGVIDHINGNPSDNRIANIRDVPQAINLRNQRLRSDNSSGEAGISFFRQTSRWHVRVGNRHVGFFKTMDEAIAARDKARNGLGYTARHGRQASEAQNAGAG